jgi:hypothetical protein
LSQPFPKHFIKTCNVHLYNDATEGQWNPLNVFKISSSQPGVRVLLGVREQLTGDTQNVKQNKNQLKNIKQRGSKERKKDIKQAKKLLNRRLFVSFIS